MKRHLYIILVLFICGSCSAQQSLQSIAKDFVKGYQALNIPELQYDYRDYLSAIPAGEKLDEQEAFFVDIQKRTSGYTHVAISKEDKIILDHLLYEVSNNKERIRLQKEWLKNGSKTPGGGLYQLGKDYYRWIIRQYTSVDISPEEVYALGEAEVKRVKKEIATIQEQMGYADSTEFYKHLNSDIYYITDKALLIKEFERVDSTVRTKLAAFIGTKDVPDIYAMEWPQATANTPPGIYLNRSSNAYGKDVFQFNFFNGRYNKRAIEWLYMHEAIPGHHLQFSIGKQQNIFEELFYYPGNFEGWGCYVEYFGKEVGLFKEPYSYLGKWEWDLVRSARLVIDVGIHYYGWSREKALQYWKQTIPNQDDIAEREVARVTNWPGQALSYKVGASRIFKIQAAWEKKYPGKPLREFYQRFLGMGRLPLSVIEQNIFV
jgi:uncharacterized protein (DUF885 family)